MKRLKLVPHCTRKKWLLNQTYPVHRISALWHRWLCSLAPSLAPSCSCGCSSASSCSCPTGWSHHACWECWGRQCLPGRCCWGPGWCHRTELEEKWEGMKEEMKKIRWRGRVSGEEADGNGLPFLKGVQLTHSRSEAKSTRLSIKESLDFGQYDLVLTSAVTTTVICASFC